MKKDFKSKKPKINFNKKNGMLELIIDPNLVNLDKPHSFADSKGLTAKNEFHITLIGSKTAERISKNLNLKKKCFDESFFGSIRCCWCSIAYTDKTKGNVDL